MRRESTACGLLDAPPQCVFPEVHNMQLPRKPFQLMVKTEKKNGKKTVPRIIDSPVLTIVEPLFTSS